MDCPWNGSPFILSPPTSHGAATTARFFSHAIATRDLPWWTGITTHGETSIDVNGSGALLTSESCLLNKNRNPNLSRHEIEQPLRDYLGICDILWLGDGIAGDDTDGHIDDLTRFVSERTVITVVEENRDDENYEPLQKNLARLREIKIGGRNLAILTLPMPNKIIREGLRLPASYANFYIANTCVLMPTFADPNDEAALSVLRERFPDRRVIGIDCRELIWGLGTFHCLTQQQPAA